LLPLRRDSATEAAVAFGSVPSTQQCPLPVEQIDAVTVPLLQCSVTDCGSSWSTTTLRSHAAEFSCAQNGERLASQTRWTNSGPVPG
jgi:hypothetical protein